MARMRMSNLSCLFSEEPIKIKKSFIDDKFYFAKEGVEHGFFRRVGNFWIWFDGLCCRRYKNLNALFKDAGKMIT